MRLCRNNSSTIINLWSFIIMLPLVLKLPSYSSYHHTLNLPPNFLQLDFPRYKHYYVTSRSKFITFRYLSGHISNDNMLNFAFYLYIQICSILSQISPIDIFAQLTVLCADSIFGYSTFSVLEGTCILLCNIWYFVFYFYILQFFLDQWGSQQNINLIRIVVSTLGSFLNIIGTIFNHYIQPMNQWYI